MRRLWSVCRRLCRCRQPYHDSRSAYFGISLLQFLTLSQEEPTATFA